MKYDFPGRDASTIYVNKETGTLGPQVDNRGPYRFSFRKAGESTAIWQPSRRIELINGDKVTLWCHSLGKGGWTSLQSPPSEANQAYFNKITKDVKFNITNVDEFEPAIFNIEFVQ